MLLNFDNLDLTGRHSDVRELGQGIVSEVSFEIMMALSP